MNFNLLKLRQIKAMQSADVFVLKENTLKYFFNEYIPKPVNGALAVGTTIATAATLAKTTFALAGDFNDIPLLIIGKLLKSKP